MAHQHKPEPATYPFRVCPKCGAGTMKQRRCSECGRAYCQPCLEGAAPATPAEQNAIKQSNRDLQALIADVKGEAE